MLKYVKQYAASIKGVDIYPIFSLLVFLLFFVAVLYYVRKMDKQRTQQISHLPLEDGEETSFFNAKINNA